MGSEIHARMCMVYGMQNGITKSVVIWLLQRFKMVWRSTGEKPQSGSPTKRRTRMIGCRHQQIHWSIRKMLHEVWQLCKKISYNLENKVFRFEVYLLIFCGKWISDAKLLKYPSCFVCCGTSSYIYIYIFCFSKYRLSVMHPLFQILGRKCISNEFRACIQQLIIAFK